MVPDYWLQGVAAGLAIPDIDTDTIIPIDYCVNRTRPHFDEGLFRSWRFTASGRLRRDFVLNKKPRGGYKMLVVGPNFGCGSSREMAVWALQDFGVSCVISVSFGEIFYNNCFQNGVLAAKISKEDERSLFKALEENEGLSLSVNLDQNFIESEVTSSMEFELDSLRKTMLVENLHPIDATLTQEEAIVNFENDYKERFSWVFKNY